MGSLHWRNWQAEAQRDARSRGTSTKLSGKDAEAMKAAVKNVKATKRAPFIPGDGNHTCN